MTTDDDRPTERVLEAIAAEQGTSPEAVEPRLDEVVDADALDRLFATTPGGHPRTEGVVTFDYGGYEVTVHADGTVDVEAAEGAE